ncbi:MAG: SHOCT domain-containing protein [Nanoarchaeota archaeon]
MENETFGWALGAIILLLLLGGIFIGHGSMGLGMNIGFVVMTIFWLAAIWFVAQAITERKDDPKKILKKRYAKGEISKKEFERIKVYIGMSKE